MIVACIKDFDLRMSMVYSVAAAPVNLSGVVSEAGSRMERVRRRNTDPGLNTELLSQSVI